MRELLRNYAEQEHDMESSRFRLQESVSGEETGTLTRSRLGYDLAGSRKRNNISRESLCNLRCGPLYMAMPVLSPSSSMKFT